MDSPELSPAVDTDRPSERESAEANPEQKPQAASTKRELRKILREDSNWSMRSITVTALTGISVAVISTQLNGLVSSFVLIAVMAFITASVSEIYRVFIALTGLGAKKAAAQAARVLPLAPRPEGSTDGSASEAENQVTEAIQVVTSAYRLNEEQEAQHPKLLKRFSYRLKNYGKANPFLLLVVLFLGIATTTVSVAYLVTDGQPPQIIQRTVEVNQSISTADREAIIADAKEQALAELNAKEPQAPKPTAMPQSVIDELQNLSGRLSTMETEIKDLSTGQPSPSPDQGSQQPLIDRISKLEVERAELTKKIAELEAKISAGSGNSPAGLAAPNQPSNSAPNR